MLSPVFSHRILSEWVCQKSCFSKTVPSRVLLTRLERLYSSGKLGLTLPEKNRNLNHIFRRVLDRKFLESRQNRSFYDVIRRVYAELDHFKDSTFKAELDAILIVMGTEPNRSPVHPKPSPKAIPQEGPSASSSAAAASSQAHLIGPVLPFSKSPEWIWSKLSSLKETEPF